MCEVSSKRPTGKHLKLPTNITKKKISVLTCFGELFLFQKKTLIWIWSLWIWFIFPYFLVILSFTKEKNRYLLSGSIWVTMHHDDHLPEKKLITPQLLFNPLSHSERGGGLSNYKAEERSMLLHTVLHEQNNWTFVRTQICLWICSKKIISHNLSHTLPLMWICSFKGKMVDKIQKMLETATGCKLSLKVFHMVKKLIRIFGSWKTKPLFEHTSHHTVFLIFREVD